MENEIAYMEKHPPRCIGKHASKASPEMAAFVREKAGDESTAFAAKCDCGSNQARLDVAWGPGPVSLTCIECGKQDVVFDPFIHGYDGEFGHNAGMKPAKAKPFRCPKCKGASFQVCCAFQYAGETDVLEDKSIKVKAEDLFGYFLVAAQCSKCGTIETAYDWECA